MSIEQRNSSVAAEMARIFGGEAADPSSEGGRAATPWERARRIADAPAPPQPQRTLAARGTALGVLLAFASAFGFLAYQAAQADPPASARTRDASPARSPEIAAAVSGKAPAPAPSVPVEPPAVPETGQVESAAGELPFPRPATSPPAAEPGEAQTTGAGSVAVYAPAERTPAYDAPRPLPPPPPAPRPDVAAESRSAAASGVDCPPGSTEDRCIYQDVLGAHRRLQRAYERAEIEGVSPAELRAVRRAWNRAHDISLDDPDETIRQYEGLADYLRRAGR